MAYVLYNAPSLQFPLQWELPQCLQAAIQQDQLSSILIIVPTHRLARRLQRQLIQQYYEVHRRALDTSVFLTLDQLAATILSRLVHRPALRLVSDAYLMVLLQKAIETAQPQYYTAASVARSPAILERLFRIIQGLKEDGITPYHLKQQLEDPQRYKIISRHRFSDIARIYERYEELLGDTLLDPPGQLLRAIEFLRGARDPASLKPVLIPDTTREAQQRRYRQAFPSTELILLSGFSDFKPPEQELLQLLQAAPFHVRIVLDFSPKNGPLFGKFQSVVESLRASGYQAFTDDAEPAEESPPETWERPLYLRRWLFNTEEALAHPDFSRMFRIYRVEDRVEEVRFLARLIQWVHHHEHVPYERMCIVSRIPEHYADLFREIFPHYRIPINVTARFFLHHSPVITAIFAVLELLLYGFRREDLHRALNTPYLRFATTEKLPHTDPNLLYTVALKHRIRGGYYQEGLAGWQQRLQQRLQQLRQYLHRLETKPYADPDTIRQLQQDIAQLQRAQSILQTLHQFPVQSIPAQKITAREFVDFVRNAILHHFGIAESILRFYRHVRSIPVDSLAERIVLLEEAEKDARAYTRFLEILEEMLFIESELFNLPRRSFEEFVLQLRTAVEHARYQVREKIGYGVTITGLEEIRGIPFDYVFLCGAIEKELPISYVPEAFLGQSLPESEEHHLQQERMLFYQVLTNNPEALRSGTFRLVITYPGFQESQELVRSSFVDALLKITTLQRDGCVWDMPELRKQLLHPEHRSTAYQRLEQLQFLQACYTPAEAIVQAALAQARGDKSAAATILSHLPEAERQRAQRVVTFVREYETLQQQRQYVRLPSAVLEQFPLLKPAEPVSVSMLEQFQRCPYQFFAERVLQLRPIEKPDFGLSPLERGTLLHTIVYRFFSELQQSSGNQPIVLDPAQQEAYQQLLTHIANEELDRLAFDHPFFQLDRQVLLGTADQPGALQRWLEAELRLVSRHHYPFRPAIFELAFGTSTETQALPPVPLSDTLLLRGKIDRIDLRISESGTLEFVIADYKTTDRGVPKHAELRRGTALQMPLYLYAAQQLLAQQYHTETMPISAVYIVLLPSPKEPAIHRFLFPGSGIPLDTSKKKGLIKLETTVHTAIATARRVVQQIRAGHFPVKPETARVCQFCPYASVCRITQFRFSDNGKSVESTMEE